MTILTKLWQALRGVGDDSPDWVMQEAKWDPTRKLYIVGPADTPKIPTVDEASAWPDWHQCLYYYETKNELPNGAVKYVRCRNLAGPGLKPVFCTLHAASEALLYSKPKVVDMPKTVITHFCRHGACIERVSEGIEYCSQHAELHATVQDDVDSCGCYGYCERHFNNGKPRTQAEIEWDAIKEDVDWEYCGKIGWGELRYRRNRKSIPVQAQEDVHFKLELRGNRDEIDLFHAVIHLCDNDYPLDPFRKNTASPERCDNCGGFVWKNAIVTPVDIKKAAKQCGMTVKVKHYFPATTCKKKDRTAGATA